MVIFKSCLSLSLKVPLEETVNGIVAMSNMQKKADTMLEDIKIKEAIFFKVSNEVQRAKMTIKKTQTSSDKLRRDMMMLQRDLMDLREKKEMIEETNTKLNLVQKRYTIVLNIKYENFVTYSLNNLLVPLE